MKKLALFMLTMLMVFTLAACGDNVSITKTEAAAVETEVYECSDFSMTIPKGWVVTSGGTNIYHSIRVYDPSEPINQMFVLLKADCLLHSKAGKEAWQSNYEMGNAQAVHPGPQRKKSSLVKGSETWYSKRAIASILSYMILRGVL